MQGEETDLSCDVVAGCDGFHGVCRDSVPDGVLTVFSREYPFGWLGILAQAPPSSEELIYAWHDRGFSLHSMRSPEITRLYLQCAPDENLDEWPDERIWEELHLRLGLDGWTLNEGPILEKGVTGMRSFVVEPMQHGRLFLAGDAAHIVPPTGAKGLNLAVADVRILGAALAKWYADGDESALASYSRDALRRVWRAEHFSWWMTTMLHRIPGGDPFDAKLQLSQLAYVASSRAAATSLAENYVGFDVADVRLTAVAALAAQHDLVRVDVVAQPAGGARDRALERGIGERLDLAAVLADHVVVMVAARRGGLEAGDPVADVDALDETEVREHLEHAVDRGDPHRAVARTQVVVDLLRARTAVLLRHQVEDGGAGAAGTEAGLAQRDVGVLAPGLDGGHRER